MPARKETLVTDRSPFASGIGYRLIKLGERAMARAEEQLAGVGIKPRQINVLATVAETPSLSQREISTALGIDPNVMVGVIDELEKSGLVRRERSQVDRRRYVLVITDKGHSVLAHGRAALAAGEKEFLAELSKEEQRIFVGLCGRLLGL